MSMHGLTPPKGRRATNARDIFKKDRRDVSQLALRIDADLHRRMKIRAATENRTMTEILEELFAEYLDG